MTSGCSVELSLKQAQQTNIDFRRKGFPYLDEIGPEEAPLDRIEIQSIKPLGIT